MKKVTAKIQKKKHTQLTFNCSKSTTKTIEKGVKYVIDVVLVFSSLTYFTPFSSVFIVDFEQINVS